MKQIFKIILIILLVVATYAPGSFVLPQTQIAQADPSGSNYTNITKYGPFPGDFRPFRADSAWNNRLPDNPQNLDSNGSSLIKTYAAHSGGTLFMTETNDALTNCVSPCAGINQSVPIYVASYSDPAVTIDCNPQPVYGCSNDDLYNRTSSIPGTFHIPANARPGVNGGFGDATFGVLQPDGTELDLYGCIVTRDWRDGDVLAGDDSGACHASGIAVANVVTGNGYNNSVSSGSAYMGLMALYNEVVPAGATINHALNLGLSCHNGTSVYPGSVLGAPDCSVLRGLPTGSRIHLSLSHAQIDSMTAPNGPLSPYMRPFYYALHDYGAYFLDGGSCGDNWFCIVPDLEPKIEDAAPWLKNGGTNPWIPWFQAQGAQVGYQDTGMPIWNFRVDIFPQVADYMDIVAPCYAQNNCSDSVIGNPTPTPPPGPPPPPVNCPTAVPSNTFTACYFNDQTLTTAALTRTDSAINFTWGTGSPGVGVSADHFSARWQGNFNFSAGSYTFTTTSDDGARLYVDGNLIMNHWVDQQATTYTASANMTAGTHLIKVEYYEATGGASMAASWALTSPVQPSPSGTRVPTASSITDAAGNVWTIGSGGSILNNGAATGGTGVQILWFNNTIYVKGGDNNWYQSYSWGYASVGPNDPGATPGDLNMDHIVNSIDWSLMNARWFTTDAAADLNHDGIVNAIDYSILNANWFKTW